MEILVTIAYFFLVQLIFFNYKWLRFNLFWKFVVFGIYFGAALTEILMLGQFTPFTKDAVVMRFVVPIAPEIGGEVIKVYVKPNQLVEKGAPLLELDPRRQKNKVEKLEAQLVQAKYGVKQLKDQLEAATQQVAVEELNITEADAAYKTALANVKAAHAENVFSKENYEMADKTFKQGAGDKLHTERAKNAWLNARAGLEAAQATAKQAKLEASSNAALLEAKATQQKFQDAYDSQIGGEHTQVKQVEAELANERIRLENRTLRAPSNGYVINLAVHEGAVVRLKTPVLTFVSNDEYWIGGKYLQRGVQWIQPGDKGEVAFEMYPGEVFESEVIDIVWATAKAQLVITGSLADANTAFSQQDEKFFVRMRLTNLDPKYPVRLGAIGIAAIYTKKAADIFILIRRIELQSESFLFYLYNPFS